MSTTEMSGFFGAVVLLALAGAVALGHVTPAVALQVGPFVAGVFAVVAALGVARSARGAGDPAELARALSLAPAGVSTDGLSFQGTLRGRRITVGVSSDRLQKHGTLRRFALTLTVPVTTTLRLELRREDDLTALERALGARELTLGDAAFDRAYEVHTSDVDHARATLTSGVRAIMVTQAPDEVRLVDGSLVVRLTWTEPRHPGADAIGSRAHQLKRLALGLAERAERVPGDDLPTLPEPTHRPLAARLARPVLMILTVAACLGLVWLAAWWSARRY